ncbi:hypothetical protein NPIL_451691 [Nephila pilipes]|uniref:Uncharacterized protein n=1 Tax=Nephila pilipes TaxID=299642 RepID=A0A8X6NBR2_NEPPI|nr:hypothetical protein NPIL_451691 [Nephila pilipes]
MRALGHSNCSLATDCPEVHVRGQEDGTAATLSSPSPMIMNRFHSRGGRVNDSANQPTETSHKERNRTFFEKACRAAHPSNPKQLNSLRLSAQKVITVLTERAQLKPVLGSHFPSISELTDHEQKTRLSMGKTGNSEKREWDHR